MLLLIAACPSMIVGLLDGAQIYGLTLDPASETLIVRTLKLSTAIGAAVWLFLLVDDRLREAKVLPPRSSYQRMEAFTLSAALVVMALPGLELPTVAEAVVEAAALVWLTLEVCARHGITPTRLGLRWESTGPQIIVLLSTVGACYLGIEAVGRLLTTTGPDGLGLPVMQSSQNDALGITTMADYTAKLLLTVVKEDLVIVAATAALMTAANRPAWQTYTLITVIEVLVHAYMGLPALGYIIYALARVLLYRHLGLVAPLIAGHLTWNLSGLD
ncbi:hypothetical protein ACFWGI_06855 [Streptomyces niveus]|uniref:hypothetical protein n=1 Tax=Streptomyces niveus TaxID=193462 RepID=UPI00365BAAE6